MAAEQRCLICAGIVEQIEKPEKPVYYLCQECNFIFMDRKFVVSPEKEKAIYDTHENTPDNEGYVNMFRDFLKKSVVPFQDEIKTALDFGSGPGPVLAMLLSDEMGFQTEIYDPYYAPVKVFEGKQYDLITSTEVFEHLSNPLMEIRRLIEHLHAGGYLAVMTHFHRGIEQFPNWSYRRDETHINFFTPQTFQKIGEILGLEVVILDEKKICVMKKEVS